MFWFMMMSDECFHHSFLAAFIRAKALEFNVAGHHVELNPIGTNLIGAKGRVNLNGINGKGKFVLVDKNEIEPSETKQQQTDDACRVARTGLGNGAL